MQYLHLPEWAEYLILGIYLFALTAVSAVVLTKEKISPYWAFLNIIPLVQIFAVWALAFLLWRQGNKNEK
jgi:hypothetical protein